MLNELGISNILFKENMIQQLEVYIQQKQSVAIRTKVTIKKEQEG